MKRGMIVWLTFRGRVVATHLFPRGCMQVPKKWPNRAVIATLHVLCQELAIQRDDQAVNRILKFNARQLFGESRFRISAVAKPARQWSQRLGAQNA